MAITIRDIAQRAGVSVATVSRVLNRTKPVTPAVREAVLAAVSDLDYVPSRMAQNLRSSRTHTISFILSSIENPFFPELIERVTQTVSTFGYDVRVSIASSPLAHVVALHKQKAFDGALVVGGDPDPESLEYINTNPIPIVAIDRSLGPHIPVFTADNGQGAFECTSHLLSHPNAGHILHIQGPAHLPICQDREAGFLRAIYGRDVTVVDVEGDFTAESGRAALDSYLAGHAGDAAPSLSAPLLVFADNDLMAIGAMSAAATRGFTPGLDILVAGFDGIDLAQWVTPALTTYNQPIATIAAAAVNKLLELINGATTDGEIVEFEGELVVRQSSGGNHD